MFSQVNVNILCSIIGLEGCEPERPVAKNPFVPVTLQLSTFVADHVIKDSLPDLICIGSAVISSTGCSTVTSTDDRPPFEHTTVNVVESRGLIETEPSAAPPVLKFSPELLVELTHANDIVTAPPSFIVMLEAPVPEVPLPPVVAPLSPPLETPPLPLVPPPPAETPNDGGGGGGGRGGINEPMPLNMPSAPPFPQAIFCSLNAANDDINPARSRGNLLTIEAIKSLPGPPCPA